MLTRLFAYVIFGAAFGAMFGIAVRTIATARGWSGGKGKRIRRVEAVVICVTAVFWLLSAPIMIPLGTSLLTGLGMEEAGAFTLMVALVVPCNALLGVAFGWIIGPEPSAKSPTAQSHFVPFAEDNPVPASAAPAPLESSTVPLHAEPSLTIPDDPPEAIPALADDASPTPFAGMGSRRSEEELWSSYGRDALFLAILGCLLLIIVCIFPGGVLVGGFLGGIVGMIASIMAIRALVLAGSRSSKGMAFAIVALVLSLIPIGVAFLSCLGLLLSFVAR